MGALTDISVGIELEEDFEGGVMHGILDHVAVVSTGRFKSAEVLSVHDNKEAEVPEVEEMAPAPVVAAFDDTELKTAIAEMTDRVDILETPDVAEFSGLEIMTALLKHFPREIDTGD